MMHLLHVMYTSDESTEQIMAMGLMDRLFYSNEPLDRLPKLLARWTPGTSTREHLCDLVEVCHMTLKLLEANAKASVQPTQLDETAKHDTVVKMKAAAAEFDVSAYFARKIVSNHTVFMYTQLLSQYAVNAPTVNHRVVALFLRLCKHKLSSGADERPRAYDEDMPVNPLAPKTVTFEPMLYNIQVLTVLNTILNDTSIRKDKDYASLLQFATTIVHDFAVAAQANPMLFVEALFKHPLPHRYCESVTNMYVTEDLRMMVERDLLLQQQQRLEQETAALANDDEEESEEELEFSDLPATKPARALVDSDDEDEDDAKPAAKPKADGEKTTNESASKKRPADKDLDDSDDDNKEEEEEGAEKESPKKRAASPTGMDHDSDDESSDNDNNDEMGRRLKRMAQRSQESQKQDRAMKEKVDGPASSSDDDDDALLSSSQPKKSSDELEAKKAKASSALTFSDSDSDEED